jgi:hypothetical protein
MQEIHGTAVGRVNAAPQATFRMITHMGRLPEWNDEIEREPRGVSSSVLDRRMP